MRGGFKAHAIHVDDLKGTIALDVGPAVELQRGELNLMLKDASGSSVFVDTTNLDDGFVGDVQVGTFGRVHKIRFNKFITQ